MPPTEDGSSSGIPDSTQFSYEIKQDCVFVYSDMGFEHTMSHRDYLNSREHHQNQARSLIKALQQMGWGYGSKHY